MSKFSERLKELREEAGLSQIELAKLVKLSKSAIAYWELGQRVPSLEAVIVLADYFNVSLDYIAGLDDWVKTASFACFRVNTKSHALRLVFTLCTAKRKPHIHWRFCGDSIAKNKILRRLVCFLIIKTASFVCFHSLATTRKSHFIGDLVATLLLRMRF